MAESARTEKNGKRMLCHMTIERPLYGHVFSTFDAEEKEMKERIKTTADDV
jgi:hypothetical protein